MARPRDLYWYALKVFYKRIDEVTAMFRAHRYEPYDPRMVEEVMENGHVTYVEKPVMASLLFVKCPEKFLIDLKWHNDTAFLYYSGPGTNKPGKIDDREMETFMAATTAKEPGLMYLGSDTAKYCVGDRVRVTDGVYKGLEGYVRRIRHARRVLVSIKGVAIVALSNIHPKFLQKI